MQRDGQFGAIVDPGTPIFLKKILITIHACQANSSVRAKIVKKFIDV